MKMKTMTIHYFIKWDVRKQGLLDSRSVLEIRYNRLPDYLNPNPKGEVSDENKPQQSPELTIFRIETP